MTSIRQNQHILVLGATGLVGQQVLRLAIEHPSVAKIMVPTRRPLPEHAKLENPLIDYDHLPREASWWQADAAICTLGTTIRQAGSPEAFRKVDHDYVMAAATATRTAGTPCFALNSSLGADPNSRNFYLRVKGEVERDLHALAFTSLTAVRPSLLDGGPRPDKRPGEFVALLFSKAFAPLIPKKWRAVNTEAVAFSLLDAALRSTPGAHTVESSELHGNAS